MPLTQLCTFTVDDLLIGVEVTQIQEVLPSLPMTRIPLAREMVRGLLNLRGQIVTAVDLRSCMGLGPRPSGQSPMNVVIRGATGNVSLLVDSIGDVIEVADDAFEAPPSTLKPGLRDLIEAVCKLPSQLLLVLVPERVLRLADAGERSLSRAEVAS
ncbi:MAG: chemotaxis protein CheW [Myxococcaceae bacterium]|nr:chemotaxis protein CheW [Myxococcaceae bacterium]